MDEYVLICYTNEITEKFKFTVDYDLYRVRINGVTKYKCIFKNKTDFEIALLIIKLNEDYNKLEWMELVTNLWQD